MKKVFLLFILVLAFNMPVLAQRENLPYLINAQSLKGYTGYIMNPSPYTVPMYEFSFGLHRFNIGVNYGLDKCWEAGVFFNLRDYEHFVSTSIAVHTKYHLLRQSAQGDPFEFSTGVNNDTLYFVFARQFEQLLDATVESGVDISASGEKKMAYFFSIAKPTKFSYFILDYNSGSSRANFGWRVLLSPGVKLDLFLTDLSRINNLFDNFIFGITLVS